ncbi:GntR family transcriptional regulator [Microbulbifer pacificus]|uniref:GntR family transcriptional regulator n=1 Tax=Microbulbifer pacificus TaxID=407164 RepID=A0AAU0N2N0_9GAMM|nr:GntR family transcriptional regulator [Microbulbifer pacificus]WOX07030.1 GntR family transcriptional regulator [Microbulbifer pacificus]
MSQSLTNECYETIKDLLIRCEIQPSERFTEKSLIERVGFGRTPVREALARLDYDGLVETMPRSGYRATAINKKTIGDLFDLWSLVGPLVARRASENLTEEDLKELDLIASKMSKSKNSIDKSLQHSNEMFTVLARITNNRDLIFLCNRLNSELQRLFRLFLLTDEGNAWKELTIFSSANTSWLRDPEIAATTISLGIASSKAGILNSSLAETLE